ncbi:hypothetical protein ABC855_g2368 [[Candida] zeylanoides]
MSPSMLSAVPLQTDVLSSSISQASTASSTPASSFSGQSTGPYLATEKCTCKSNANRIPRPRNAFILFRQRYHQSVLDEGTVTRTNPEVSRELGRRWRNLSSDEKDYWNNLAEEEKATHARKFPNYRYTPRRNGKARGCEGCRQKLFRQQQTQLHHQQSLQLQQDQYQQYLQLQSQIQQQQVQLGQLSQQPHPQVMSQSAQPRALSSPPNQSQLQQHQQMLQSHMQPKSLHSQVSQQYQPQAQQLSHQPQSQSSQLQQQQMLATGGASGMPLASQVAPPPLSQQYVQYVPFQQNFQMSFSADANANNFVPAQAQPQLDQKLSPLSAPNASGDFGPQLTTIGGYEQRYYATGMDLPNYQI